MKLSVQVCYYKNNGMRERGLALFQGNFSQPFAIVPIHAVTKDQIYDTLKFMPDEFGVYPKYLEVE